MSVVDTCVEAASRGDLRGVQESVSQFFGDRRRVHGALSSAIQKDDLPIVQFLVESDVVFREETWNHPGEDAIRCRAYKTLQYFIDCGWDINTPLGEKEPPALRIPICTGDREMIDWLLDHGASLNTPSPYLAITPMSYAMSSAPRDLIEDLFCRHGDVDPHQGDLITWAIFRDTDDDETLQIVRLAERHGAPIDRTHPWYFGDATPLHHAVEAGKIKVVQFLLEKGADCTRLDNEGRRPVD
ncbi:ankyrin [Sporormia fimetaria CBS 119925]|uniref:Ankyrin n=1 Tax=Sporormia fimetaria CBS 119925 TaxID=1340428 RepID=A0A6A6VFC5_9PLEO|nr:ankyrin [Sporormia fimetaria CBS 119925]